VVTAEDVSGALWETGVYKRVGTWVISRVDVERLAVITTEVVSGALWETGVYGSVGT